MLVNFELLAELPDGFDLSQLYRRVYVEFDDGWMDMDMIHRIEVDGLQSDQRETVHYLHDQGQSIDDIVDQTGYPLAAVKLAVQYYTAPAISDVP